MLRGSIENTELRRSFCFILIITPAPGYLVWCNSVALFVLPDLQILEMLTRMLIGVDGVERPGNEARVTLN